MSNAPHILVIDDEPQIQRAIKTILTEKGFKVTTASSGEQGLTLAAANEPDIVILDLGLPDMDGVDVCMRLREWTQCPIIILSVRDSEHDKVTALDKGADDYLTKPSGIEELLARACGIAPFCRQAGDAEQGHPCRLVDDRSGMAYRQTRRHSRNPLFVIRCCNRHDILRLPG